MQNQTLHYSYLDLNLCQNEFINTDFIDTLNYNIDNNLVEPYFQAIMDNKNDKIIKYEALMRIFDKDNNIILPNILFIKQKSVDFITNLWKF